MILRGAPVLLVAALLAACATNGRAASSPTSVAAASPSATPLIDVNDMMGAFPPATFFVPKGNEIKAIALLNHATRYTIPTSGASVQVATSGESDRFYVLDQVAEGARVRWFDVNSGNERASRVIAGVKVVETGIGHGALAVDDKQGTVYALLREPLNNPSNPAGFAVRVDEFDWFTLRPARTMLRSFCGERVAAAAGRVAVVCLHSSKDGELRVADGTGEFKLATDPMDPNSMAMLGDGTLMVGDAQGSLARLARHATTLDRVNTLKEYGKGLIPDGIAANGDCCFYFGIIDGTANDVQPRVIAGGTALIVFPSIAMPTGGLFVQPPFAYYVIGGRARHTDITQGFSEVMADLGAGAVPGAVSNR